MVERGHGAVAPITKVEGFGLGVSYCLLLHSQVRLSFVELRAAHLGVIQAWQQMY